MTGSSLHGHLVSILSHGIFERSSDAPHVDGRAPSRSSASSGAGHQLEAPERNPDAAAGPEYVWEHVRFSTQPLEEPDDPEQLARVLEPFAPETLTSE